MKRKDAMKAKSEIEDAMDENMEEKLEGMLNPVAPRSSYINELQHRLTRTPEISVEYPNYLVSILVLSSGFVVGTLLLFVVSKLIRLTSHTKV